MIWAFVLKNWQLVALGIAVLIALTAIPLYGASRYEAGEQAERLLWEQRLTDAQARANEAERQLNAETIRLNETIRERDLARQRSLTQVETEITNAPGFEERYSAYLAHRNSVRQSSAEHLARARADYLSSIPSSPNRGPGSDRSELRVSLAGRGSTLCLEA